MAAADICEMCAETDNTDWYCLDDNMECKLCKKCARALKLSGEFDSVELIEV